MTVAELQQMISDAKARHPGSNDWWKEIPEDWFKGMEPHDVAYVQLHEEILIMPFGDFHAAVEKALDRPVWTHEFADNKRLQDELSGARPKSTFSDVIGQLKKYDVPVHVVIREDEK